MTREEVLADLAGLVEFAAAGRVDDGFAWLDLEGWPDHGPGGRPVELWITCRTTHVAALAALVGLELPSGTDPVELVDHGLAALRGALHDDVHGGWFGGAGRGASRDKEAYGHAFVVLAAASGTAVGRPGARELLDEALRVVEERFWVEADGMAADRWDETFSDLDPYRGVNANMHLVEALLAAHDVTGDAVHLDRAVRITTTVVQRFGRPAGYRLPEHYDEAWSAQRDLNRDRPEDLFRPYGVTIGHLYEWARLAVHVVRAAPDRRDLLDDARALFERATTDGWAVDGRDGFVYTTDFDGVPVVRERLHWVAAEALGAATVLDQDLDDPRYAALHRTWSDWVEAHVVDRVGGSWWHELDERNRPAGTVWPGKPDVYHAYQACVLPSLPLRPTAAVALAGG